MTQITHHVFHSMGIPVHITLAGVKKEKVENYIKEIGNIFNKYDERFSRFKNTSELHKVNTANGEWTPVSLPMFQILKESVALAVETGGAFDPSVGGILASYGYGLPEGHTVPSPAPTYRNIEFDDRELSVRLTPGQVLEPASIVKGVAIDEAGKSLAISEDVIGFLINAGGDIITHGPYKNDAAWNIGIQDPRNPDAIVGVVALRDKGMATSGTYQTKGIHQGKEWHHLVDMRTGKPSEGIVSATVIADTCEEADTEASLAILLSEEDALLRLRERGLPYFLIRENGEIKKSATFAALEVPIQSIVS